MKSLRIKYKHCYNTANMDKSVYEAWANREISTREAIRRLTVNNGCPVTEAQFYFNVAYLGYTNTEQEEE